MFEKTTSVRILDVDPDLGEGLGPERFAAARRDFVASAGAVDAGSWEPLRDLPEDDRRLGLLVTEGLLLRAVAVADTTCAELVGEGDILRPWEHFGETAPMPYEVSWQVLTPTKVAVLDRRASEAIGRYPEVMEAIVARAIARAHALALALAMTNIKGVEIRLLVLLWHLADRWGKVTPNGVHLRLRLTHETLGRLIGARRPSVSTALSDLLDQGFVEARPDGWMLHGDPPEALSEMHERRRT